jgi:dihydrolipoamide dehydrogenase
MYDLLVIGSGPGGYVAAIRAAQLGLKSACVEKGDLGGTCLNVGCIPSKSLLHSSHLYETMGNHVEAHGIKATGVKLDFTQMMKLKQETVTGFNVGIAGLFKKNKVDHLQGVAKVIGPGMVQIGKKQVEAKNILLATGSEPIPLPFLPFDEKQVLSSTGALALTTVPKKMILIGGGVIGVELASVYSRLGSSVTVVEMLDTICPGMDKDVSKGLYQAFKKQGMKFLLSSQVKEAKATKKGVSLQVETAGKTQTLDADVVLVAVGRRPYSEGLGLEEVGVKKSERGFVEVNHLFQTSVPSIYAIGDLVEGPMLAHKASEEGIAAVEAIAGNKAHVNYMAIPSVIYTQPEGAGVGLTEEEAKEAGLAVTKFSFPFRANSRARCTGDDEGFVKVLGDKQTGRLVGMHIVHGAASELIAEGMMALVNNATVADIAMAPHAHPTLSEAIKEAALGIHAKPIHM